MQKETVQLFSNGKLEGKSGSGVFRRMVITMTCDGAGNFMDDQDHSSFLVCLYVRTSLCFAHPYSVCARGVNKKHNRMLRLLNKRRDRCTRCYGDEQLSPVVSIANKVFNISILTILRVITIYRMPRGFVKLNKTCF